MATNIPIVRQIAWISIIPHFIIMFTLFFIFNILGAEKPILWGALTYLIISFLLRKLIAHEHSKGLTLIKQGKYDKALSHFEKSADFFTKNNWIDRYREMSLCNIAFCYSQTQRGLKAKEYYELVLQQYPENGIAIAGLNMIQSLASPEQIRA